VLGVSVNLLARRIRRKAGSARFKAPLSSPGADNALSSYVARDLLPGVPETVEEGFRSITILELSRDAVAAGDGLEHRGARQAFARQDPSRGCRRRSRRFGLFYN
jgi:hypothetical protein